MKKSLFSFFVKMYILMVPILAVSAFIYNRVYHAENWLVNSFLQNLIVPVVVIIIPILAIRFSPNLKKLKEIKVFPIFKYTFLSCVIVFDIIALLYAFLVYESGRTNVFASFDFLKEKKSLVSSIDKDFKIYDNKYRGFVIKYPSSWKVEDKNGEKSKIVKFSAPFSSTFDEFRESLLLGLTTSAKNLEQLEKEVNSTIQKMSFTGIKVESNESFLVDNKTWKKIIVSGKSFENDSIVKIAYFFYVDEKNHKDYLFNYTGHDSDFEKYLPQAEEIIKSFIF